MNKEEVLKILQEDVKKCDIESEKKKIFYYRNEGRSGLSLEYDGNSFMSISIEEASEMIANGKEHGGIK